MLGVGVSGHHASFPPSPEEVEIPRSKKGKTRLPLAQDAAQTDRSDRTTRSVADQGGDLDTPGLAARMSSRAVGLGPFLADQTGLVVERFVSGVFDSSPTSGCNVRGG